MPLNWTTDTACGKSDFRSKNLKKEGQTTNPLYYSCNVYTFNNISIKNKKNLNFYIHLENLINVIIKNCA